MNGHLNGSNFNQNYDNYNSQFSNHNQIDSYSQNYPDMNSIQTYNKSNPSSSYMTNYNLSHNSNQTSLFNPINNQSQYPTNNTVPSQYPTSNTISSQYPTNNSYGTTYTPKTVNQVESCSSFQPYPQVLYPPSNLSSNPQTNCVSQPSLSNLQNHEQTYNSDLSNKFKTMQLAKSNQDKIVDLMQKRNLFSEGCNTDSLTGPKVIFPVNCDPKIMQCTLNTLPIDANLLAKSRLPLGVHIQPFRDSDIVTISTNSIVRCRPCRTYINPFVTLTENQRRWHCNVCGKVNDIPDELMFDPVTKTYGNPSQRPELKYCNIEYTANPEYTVRPPMCTMYVFLLDVSKAAVSSGYLEQTCKILIENLSNVPGDRRTQIAFFTYSSVLNYYQIQENSYKMVIWPDVEEIDLPLSEDLLVNLYEKRDIILEFLANLPSSFSYTNDTGNCLGFGIHVAMKLIGHNGGRITIINASLPNMGPGSLKVREYKEGDLKTMQPATDFYKSLALQCANDQISVDMFCINRQYSDIASISAITRHSSGCLQYYGNFRSSTVDSQQLEPEELIDNDRFAKDFKRYLTRKIGFEAVMRTRFTQGLDLTAFHGNLFMRSTNVIALPIVNPDNSYLIQFKINNSLSDWNYVIIQSALLYTTSESDRRIRVHTLCLPLSSNIEDVFMNANSHAISGLLTKIAIDKCINEGFNNVRDAFVNSLVDPLKVFNIQSGHRSLHTKPLMCPLSLRLLASFILGLLRNPAFKASANVSIDERMATFECLRSLPLVDILHRIYPYLVSVHELCENVPLNVLAASKANPVDDNNYTDDHHGNSTLVNDSFTYPTRLNLTSAVISREGAFLMDCGSCFYLFLGNSVPNNFLKHCFGIDDIRKLPGDSFVTNFDLNNAVSNRLSLVKKSIANRSIGTSVITLLPDSKMRSRVLNYLVEDRMENAMSYFEFLKSIQSLVYS